MMSSRRYVIFSMSFTVKHFIYLLFFNAHTHSNTASNNVVSIVNQQYKQLVPQVTSTWYSVGVHPWSTTGDVTGQLTLLAERCKVSSVVAIGECGLDAIQGGTMQYQTEVFEHHIAISERNTKPLIIHCVRAFAELLRLRKTSKAIQPWMVHGFSKSIGLAEQLLDAGLYLSFGPNVLQNNSKVHQVCMLVPLDRMFLETDDSDVKISDVYEQVARLRNISVEDLCKIQQTNFKTVFNL